LTKVLHIDDEEMVLELTKEFLALDGIEVHGMTDSLAVKDELAREEYDVVISDYLMPSMNGLELLESLRKDGISVPFILFTGKGREDVAIEALNHGADFYVQKGGDPKAQFAELSNMVTKCVERTHHHHLITSYTDMVNNVQSALMAFRLTSDGDTLEVSTFNPRARKLIEALGGDQSERSLEKIVPGIFTCNELDRLKEMAVGPCPPLKASWQGVLGGKMRYLQIDTYPLPGRSVGVIVNEVTAMALAEKRMNWAEEKYRSFFHSGYLPMVVTDNDTKRIVEVNDRLCDMYGYGREELVGHPITMLSAEPEATLETLENVRALGLQVVHTRYHRLKDGTLIPVQVISGRLVSEGRDMVTGIVLDIRERIESEARLRSLSKAVENSPVTILITDPEGSIKYVNPKFTSLTGYSVEEVVGRNPSVLSSGRTPREVYDDMWRTLSDGGTWKGEFANRKKNGDLYWESASISPIVNESGKIVNYVAVKEDITDAKAMAERSAYLSEMVTRAVNEIYSFDCRTLHFEFVNQSALDNLGYAMEDMRSKTPLDLQPSMSPKTFDGILERLRSGREPVIRFESEHRRNDGTSYSVEVHLQLIGQGNDRRFLAIIIDITDRRRMEDDLRRLNEKARVLGALTRHDIMNQVTVLLGNMGLMKEKVGAEERRLGTMMNAAHKIERYVKFSAAFEKAGSVSPEWQDLRGTIADSWAELTNGQVDMVADLPPVEVLADSMFPKVFDNLFANSLEHATGLRNIRVGWEERDGSGVIVYTDDGPGIPESVRASLFTKSSGGDRGLGLFLTGEVLRVTGMEMRECGELGKGVRFEIVVPDTHWRI